MAGIWRRRCVFCRTYRVKESVFAFRHAGMPVYKVTLRERLCRFLQRLVCKFISICVSHNVRSQNFHAQCPFCVSNWLQGAEALRVLFNSFLAPVISSGNWVSPHILYYLVIEAEVSKSTVNEQFSTTVTRSQNEDTRTKSFFVCSYPECRGDLVGDWGRELFFIQKCLNFFLKQP